MKNLNDSYVAAVIGMKLADCHKLLIELKRAQLMVIRACRGGVVKKLRFDFRKC